MCAFHRFTMLASAVVLCVASAGQAAAAPAKPGARPAARAAGSSNAQIRAFNANIMVLNNDFSAQSQALDARIDALKVGDVIQGDQLASAQTIQAGRAAVAQMRALLDERAQAERLYHENTARLMTRDVEKAVGAKDVDLLHKRLAHAGSTSAQLLKARLNYTVAIDNVLSWAEKQGADIEVIGGKVSLPSERQIAELQTLYEAVNAAADEEGRIVDAMVPIFQQYQKLLEQMEKDAQRR